MAIRLERGYVASIGFMTTGAIVLNGVVSYFDGFKVQWDFDFAVWLISFVLFIALCIYTFIYKEWLERILTTGAVLLLIWLVSLL